MTKANVDQAEVDKFEALAQRWWDAEGDFKTLHDQTLPLEEVCARANLHLERMQ